MAGQGHQQGPYRSLVDLVQAHGFFDEECPHETNWAIFIKNLLHDAVEDLRGQDGFRNSTKAFIAVRDRHIRTEIIDHPDLRDFWNPTLRVATFATLVNKFIIAKSKVKPVHQSGQSSGPQGPQSSQTPAPGTGGTSTGGTAVQQPPVAPHPPTATPHEVSLRVVRIMPADEPTQIYSGYVTIAAAAIDAIGIYQTLREKVWKKAAKLHLDGNIAYEILLYTTGDHEPEHISDDDDAIGCFRRVAALQRNLVECIVFVVQGERVDEATARATRWVITHLSNAEAPKGKGKARAQQPERFVTLSPPVHPSWPKRAYDSVFDNPPDRTPNPRSKHARHGTDAIEPIEYPPMDPAWRPSPQRSTSDQPPPRRSPTPGHRSTTFYLQAGNDPNPSPDLPDPFKDARARLGEGLLLGPRWALNEDDDDRDNNSPLNKDVHPNTRLGHDKGKTSTTKPQAGDDLNPFSDISGLLKDTQGRLGKGVLDPPRAPNEDDDDRDNNSPLNKDVHPNTRLGHDKRNPFVVDDEPSNSEHPDDDSGVEDDDDDASRRSNEMLQNDEQTNMDDERADVAFKINKDIAPAPNDEEKEEDPEDKGEYDPNSFANELDKATGELAIRSQLSTDKVTAYCRAFGKDPLTWKPSDTTLLPGFRRALKEYQMFTVYYMLTHEGQYSTQYVDGTIDRVGGCLGHEPGLGKTTCVLAMCGLNMLLGRCATEVSMEQSNADQPVRKHLPLGAAEDAECPHNAVRGTKIRCLCESPNRKLLLSVTQGAHLIAAPKNLLVSTWYSEFKAVFDIDAMEDVTGKPLRLAMEHDDSRKAIRRSGASDIELSDLTPYHPKALTLPDWYRANPDIKPEDINRLRCARQTTGLNLPDIKYPRLPLLIVLTTPETFVSRIDKAFLVPIQLSQNVTIPCVDKSKCPKVGPKCKAAWHTETTAQETGIGFNFARVFLDEAHSQRGTAPNFLTQFQSCLGRLIRKNRDGFKSRSACWAVTGTPMATTPTDMLPFFRIQWDEEWSRDASLRQFEPKATKVMLDFDAWMPTYRNGDKHAAKKMKGAENLPIQLGDSEERVLRKYTKTVLQPTLDFVKNHMIQFKGDDRYNDTPLERLPNMETIQKMFTLPKKGHDQMDEGISRFATYTQRVKNLRAQAPTQRQADVGTLRDARAKRMNAWRVINAGLCIPTLIPFYSGDDSPLLASTIMKNNWWVDPKGAPLTDEKGLDQIYDESPKLQWLVQLFKTQPKRTSVWFDERGHPKTLKHMRKVIITAYEPSLVLYTWLVLRHKIGHIYPPESIQCIYSGCDVSDITNRFQVLASQDRNIDILLICSRVGDRGLTLTKSDVMIHLDADPGPARAIQIKKRIHRISQTQDVRIMQLVTRDFDVEAMVLKQRDKGIEVTADLLEMRDDAPAASGT